MKSSTVHVEMNLILYPVSNNMQKLAKKRMSFDRYRKGITITSTRSQLQNAWARSGLPASLPFETLTSDAIISLFYLAKLWNLNTAVKYVENLFL